MSIKFRSPGQQTSSHPSRIRTWMVVTGAAVVATGGLLMPAAARAAQASTAHYPGAAAASVRPSSTQAGSQPESDAATEITMKITNNTGQILNLVNASHSGTDVHWDEQAPATIAVGHGAVVTAYSGFRDTTVDLTYQGAYDDTVYTMHGLATVDGSLRNNASGTSNSPSYTVASSIGGGITPTATYNVEPGGTFTYTGKTTTYTVPSTSITKLKVEVIGGGTQDSGNRFRGTGGADVTGVLAVTPGEQLTIGAGGQGGASGTDGPNPWTGGWGMTINGDNYSGGSTNDGSHDIGSNPGGGATVVTDSSSGSIIAVAGGGGGDGAVSTDCDAGHLGGDGGADGSWTGGNGTPWPGGGGQAGANTTTQGQASTAGDDCQGGAGGGGVKGGLAGVDGGGAGGGAGSSAAPGLTGATITSNAPKGTNPGDPGKVIISADLP